jgi:hypothetical protein
LTDPADASRLRTIWYLSSGGSRDLADDVAHVIHDNYARVVADVLMKKVAAKTKAQARLADEIRSPSLGDVTERQNQLFVEQKGDGRFYVRRWGEFRPKGIYDNKALAIEEARGMAPGARIQVERKQGGYGLVNPRKE